MNNFINVMQQRSSMITIALLLVLTSLTEAYPAMAATLAQDDAKWVEVEAEGRGTTAKEARKAAILAALREIAGEFLMQNTTIEDGQITDDVLIMFTTEQAFESEDLEGFPTIEGDGTWYVKMKIRVIARDFNKMLDRLQSKGYIVGKQSVQAEGTGESAAEAERNAIANGVRQIVGEYVESEIVINDEGVVTDLIKTYTTSKNVTSERIGNFRIAGDKVAVTMRVTAELGPLYALIRERFNSATVIDGDVLAAELDLARGNIVAQRKILRNLLKELPTHLLVARLIDRQGKPIENGRPSADDMKPIIDGAGDEIAIAINVQCYFDLETFYTRVAPALSQAMDAMATKPKATGRVKSKYSKSGSNVGSPVLFTGELVRELDLGPNQPGSPKQDHSWPFTYHEENELTPDECQILIPRQCNETGTEHYVESHILPKDLLPAFDNLFASRASLVDETKITSRLIVFIHLMDKNGEPIEIIRSLPPGFVVASHSSNGRPSADDMKPIKEVAWNTNSALQEGRRATNYLFGEHLPIYASQRGSHWPLRSPRTKASGIDTLEILPSFGPMYSRFYSAVSRFELTLSDEDFERLDHIALSAQILQKGQDDKWSKLNADLDPIALGWKDAKGDPIEPGGAFGRKPRTNRGSSSSASGPSTQTSSGQSPTINEDALAASENRVRAQKEAQRQAELKQFGGLVDKLGNYAMNGICDKARSTADELLSMDQELMNEDKLWLGITKTGRCPRAQKELLEKLIELYPDRPRTKTAKKMLKNL